MILLLVALPGYALSRFATRTDWRLLVGIPVAASLFTYFAYRSDKRRAEAGEWRVPESTLHLGELCGGWPGAFLAQRKYRHKTAKASFQITFWTIVLIHQFAAFDSLRELETHEACPGLYPSPYALSRFATSTEWRLPVGIPVAVSMSIFWTKAVEQVFPQ
jgi:uncharacterized membrane protein YsdA (DUF1294 family)